MIITKNDTIGITTLKSQSQHHFEIKDLGVLRYFLGIEVAYSPKVYFLSQSKYAYDIIKKAWLFDSRTVDTPLEFNVRYSSSNGVLLFSPWLVALFILPSLVWI